MQSGENVTTSRRGQTVAMIVPARAADGACSRQSKKRFAPQLDFAGLRRLRDSMPMSPLTSVELLRLERDERDAALLKGARA